MIAPAAPAVLDAAPSTPPVAQGHSAASSGFDAILLLQSLAATTETQAGFEASDTSEALAGEDGDDDDADDDLEASLLFLTSLINAAAPQNSANDSGDSAAGAGQHGAAEEEAGALPALAIKADTGFALTADDATDQSDALLGLAAVPPESLESRAAGGDPSQNLARAAELLAQAQRPAADVDKPMVTTHARDPRWADDFGARVSLMVRGGESAASLQMTPVDLGPVEVNVTVKDSQATIHFGASQAETRALIEASLPRLRELLASQGFNLLDASVSSGFTGQQKPEFASSSRGGAGGESETSTTEARVTRQMGLLDLYA